MTFTRIGSWDLTADKMLARKARGRFVRLGVSHAVKNINVAYETDTDRKVLIVDYYDGYPVQHWRGTEEEFYNLEDVLLRLMFSDKPKNAPLFASNAIKNATMQSGAITSKRPKVRSKKK